MKGILGKKLGMTQVFTKSGKMIPVTVIEVEPNIVTQIKTTESDGYNAVQLGFSTKRDKLSNKAEKGHLKKANTTPKRFLKEIRDVEVKDYQLGQEVTVNIFSPGEVVDVTGTSKGKGFQGVIKRHNYSRGPMSHGSHFHRRPGSLGSMRPKRVFKGTKLPGHMGVDQVTIQNLEIVMIDEENNVLLVKGNVPGAKKSLVMIKTAVKQPEKINEAEELSHYDSLVVETEEVTEETVEETAKEVAEEEQVTEPSEEVAEEEQVAEASEEVTEEEPVAEANEEVAEETEVENQEEKHE